jgi:hypothetical protein
VVGLINIKATVMCSSGAHYIDENMIPDTIEKCVSCDAPTPYKFNDNIFVRNYYIEGAGQLCEMCYVDVYGKS